MSRQARYFDKRLFEGFFLTVPEKFAGLYDSLGEWMRRTVGQRKHRGRRQS